MIGNSLFLILESTEFCNDYIRPYLGLENQKHGLVNLKEFMDFFGLVFIVSTTMILLFKKETNQYNEESIEINLSINDTFKLLLKIINLEPVKKLLLILFTCKIAFATHSIRSLKMIEAGVPKETLGLINGYFQFVQILTPIFIGRYLDLNKPMELFLKRIQSGLAEFCNLIFFFYKNLTTILRMVFTIVLAIWVYITPSFKDLNGRYSFNYFMIYILLNSVYSLIFSSMGLFKTAFFTHISDKKIGGTYMTLLNTIANIGVHWPMTLALYLIDVFSQKACMYQTEPVMTNMSVVGQKSLSHFMRTIDKNTCYTEFESKVYFKVVK